MARSEALISPNVLAWALDRVGSDVDQLASKLNIEAETVADWLSGASRPTFKQAENAARALHIPFGFLFLDNPPSDELPIPDLRTIGDATLYKIDANTSDLIRDIFYKRDWYREHLVEQGAEPLKFVGSFTNRDDPGTVARSISDTLHPENALDRPIRSFEDRLRALMIAAEEAGIWVMRSGIVANNTRRPLSVAQFRGFAVSDSILPLIFINGRDAVSAQIFTFAHELAHIWIGESGISSPDLGTIQAPSREVERFCNRVAAEYLTPASRFRSLWNKSLSSVANVDTLSREFKVSRAVAARTALDLDLIDRQTFSRLYQGYERERIVVDEEEDSKGGDFLRTLPIRNGSRFTDFVLRAAAQGDILIRDAASLLHVKPTTLNKLFRARMET